MKKFILVVLVMVFMLALATTAFADGPATGASCEVHHAAGPPVNPFKIVDITVNLHAVPAHNIHGDATCVP